MSDSNGSETNPIVNNHEIIIDNESKTRNPSQKEVDEQIRNYLAPLNSHLEDLTQLIQGTTISHRPNISPRAGTSASSSTSSLSPAVLWAERDRLY